MSFILSNNILSFQCSATWLVWVRGCVCGARRRPGYHGWPPPSQSVTSPPGELGSAGTGPPGHTAGSAEHRNFSHQSKRLPYNMHDGGQKLFFFLTFNEGLPIFFRTYFGNKIKTPRKINEFIA